MSVIKKSVIAGNAGNQGGTPLGNWDASTNTPTLLNPPTPPTYQVGDYYIVSVAGTQFGFTFTINDKIIVIQDGSALAWNKEAGGAVDSIAGENYLSLSNQQITANPVTLSGSNVTGILPNANTTAEAYNGGGNTAFSIVSRDTNGEVNANTANTALTANQIGLGPDTTTAVTYPLFSSSLGPSVASVNTNSGYNYNAVMNALTATTFIGALTGNSSTATALQTARTIGGVSFNGTANIIPQTTELAAAPSDLSTSGNIITLTAGEDLVFGDPVYIKADGKMWKGDANTAGAFPVQYMAAATIATDASGVFLRSGIARNDAWSWTVGGTIYLSTTGTLTQTAPSATGDANQTLGFATHVDRIDFNPSPDYITRI